MRSTAHTLPGKLLVLCSLLGGAALSLSACGNPDDLTATDEAAASGGLVGVDYSWSRPSIAGLRSAGYHYACRYLSFDTTGKNLSRGEADALKAHGLDVVVVWEQNANDALGGFGRGAEDARAAEAQARADGMPAGRPIYFAIDFDASPGDQGAIDSYFDGVASVIGRHRAGVYAGYWPTKRLFDAGKIAYGWQTYAWSGGQWDHRAQLRQVLNGIGGGDLDKNIAVAPDYGQWGFKGGSSDALRERIAVGHHIDGRLEVFSAGANDAISHDWEKVGGGWSGHYGFGGRAQQIAVAENADGRIEVFYVGTDSKIYHNWQTVPNGPWFGELAFGGDAKQIAVGKHPDGRLEVFYIGTNDELYHNFEKVGGGWSGEVHLGGKAQELAVGENADGRIEVFYVGTNDELYHNWQTAPNGPWEGEHAFGGKGKQLSVGNLPDGRLEVFYIGTDDELYHNYEKVGSGWSGEQHLGGKAKQIAAAANKDGRLELFYIGTDDELYHNYQTAPESGWVGQEHLGGKAKQIAVGRNGDGRLEVFYIGTNDALYHNWQDHPDAGWAGEHAL